MKKIQSQPSFKGAFGRSRTKIYYLNQNSLKELRHKICDNAVVTYPVVIYTRKNFYLIDELNKKIEILRSAGLIDFWNHEIIDVKKSKVEMLSSPKVLSFVHIIGSFQILLAGSVSGCLVFVFEKILPTLHQVFDYKKDRKKVNFELR